MRTVRNFIDGKWVDVDCSGYLDVENPNTGDVIGKVPLSTADEAGRAVKAAREAYKVWGKTPVTGRVEYLFELLHLLKEHEEEISRLLTKEMGKSLPDSRAEMKRVFQNIEAACGAPILQNGEKMVGCASAIDGEILRLPKGVFAAITPFNFPAMAPFW